MKKIFKKSPAIFIFTVCMIIYSILLLCFSHWIGIDFGEGTTVFKGQEIKVKGYMEKYNWLLFPLYWPVVSIIMHNSWNLYLKSWNNLYEHGIVYSNGDLATNPLVVAPLVARLKELRPKLTVLSFGFAFIVCMIDTRCLLVSYKILNGANCAAPDFTVAGFYLDHFPNFTSEKLRALKLFVLLQYIMQLILVTIAFQILFQLLLHSYTYLRFESRKIPKKLNLSIKLNITDPLNQFGLSDVNKAINLTYIYIAIGMTIPAISASQKPPGFDPGQLMLSIFLPLLVFSPAIIPIFDRINRHEEAQRRVKKINKNDIYEKYLQQRLWPMEKTRFSNLGKLCLSAGIAQWLFVVYGEAKHILKIF